MEPHNIKTLGMPNKLIIKYINIKQVKLKHIHFKNLTWCIN